MSIGRSLNIGMMSTVILLSALSINAKDNFGNFEPGERVMVGKDHIGLPSIEACKEYVELAQAGDTDGIKDKLSNREWVYFYMPQTSVLIIKYDPWNGVYKVRILDGLFKSKIVFVSKAIAL